MSCGLAQAADIMEDLFQGRLQESPFPAARIDAIKSELDGRLEKEGWPVSLYWHHPLKVHPHFSRMGSFLAAIGDFAAQWLIELPKRRGVPIGVDEDLPRVPAVFPEKTKWKLDEPDDPWAPFQAENHPSVVGRDWLRTYKDKELEKGAMVRIPEEDSGECSVAALTLVAKPAEPEEEEDDRAVFEISTGRTRCM